MLSLILSETSLELVPYELKDHPSIVSHAHKLRRDPTNILLDNSWHFAAMKGIENEIKRGRPDLAHFSILAATMIPLYYNNKMKFFVHTINDNVIYFNQNVRVPKSYHRFEGLIEKLFKEKKILSYNDTLLEIKPRTFSELINEINPSQTIGLSTVGESNSFEEIAAKISNNTCLVIGGFQKGNFTDSTRNKINHLYSVGHESLEGHIVISRMLYEYEKTIFM